MAALPGSFFKMVVFNLIMLLVISFFYAEPFSFAMDPLSWLGRLETDNGPNTTAFLLFAATLLFDAFSWYNTLPLIEGFPKPKQPIFQLLAWAVLIGFILMAFPCDKFSKIHCLGAGLLVGGFWALTGALLFLARERLKKAVYIALHFILHAAALFCAICFVCDNLLKGFSQRPLLLAIIAELGLCLKALWQDEARTEFGWHYKSL
ncbi:MAG TPA: hypothetical protein GX528_02895 [Firmicutes bacterium]|nr:hypothetical protein [Bacillota bacterium]